MKKIDIFYLMLFAILFTFLISEIISESKHASYNNEKVATTNDIDTVSITYQKTIFVNLTVYNPTKEQCDDSFLATASGNIINTANPEAWVAMSQDLIKQHDIKWGDMIEIISDVFPFINGYYKVMDTGHIRIKNTIEILVPKDSRYVLKFYLKNQKINILK